MIADSIKTLISQFSLGSVATITPDGHPKVSPKGTFLVLDDTTLAFGEIRSPGTMRNLAATPECEVNFVDPFTRKGARISGATRILPRGTPEFDALVPKWRAVWGDLEQRINALVLIDVAEVRPLTTPPYDDGATSEEMIALYKQKYAEIYP